MQRRLVLWLSITVVALVAAACLFPTTRYVLIEVLKHEPWAEARTILNDAGTAESADAQRRPLSFWIHQLNDKQARRRLQAAKALGSLGPRAQPAPPTLLQVVRDEHLAVRLAVIESLGRIGPDAKDAVPELFKLYSDRNEKKEVRKTAVVALGRMGPAAKDAVPVMIRMLAADESFALSGHIQMAVTGMGRAAVPCLIQLLQDQDPEVRGRAVVALNWIGPGGRDAVPALVRALQHEDPEVGRAAALALQRVDADPAAAQGAK